MPLNIPPQARPYRSGARMPDPIGARRAGAERRLLKQREQQNAMAIQKEQEARELDAARNEAFAQAPDINAYRLDRQQAGDRSGWDNSFAMDKTQRQFKQNLQTDQFRAGLTSWSMGDYKGTAVAWGQLPGFESITPGSISKSKNNQVVFTNPQTGEVIEIDPTSLAEASGLLGGKKKTGSELPAKAQFIEYMVSAGVAKSPKEAYTLEQKAKRDPEFRQQLAGKMAIAEGNRQSKDFGVENQESVGTLFERYLEMLGGGKAPETGTVKALSGGVKKKGSPIPEQHIQILRDKDTPAMRQHFDQAYGKGAAAAILGGQSAVQPPANVLGGAQAAPPQPQPQPQPQPTPPRPQPQVAPSIAAPAQKLPTPGNRSQPLPGHNRKWLRASQSTRQVRQEFERQKSIWSRAHQTSDPESVSREAVEWLTDNMQSLTPAQRKEAQAILASVRN